MRFSLNSTFSAFFSVTSVVLLAWTLVVQSAAVSVHRDRAATVDFGPSADIIVFPWRRVVVARDDDTWYTEADVPGSKREETPCSDLLKRVDAPGDDTSFTPDEPSTPTECNAPDGGDCKYSLVYTNMSETDEGSELARRDVLPDHDTWYTLDDTEGTV